MMRTAVMFGLGAAVFVGVMVSGVGEAAAICAAPVITLAPARGTPGSAVVVSGQNFISTCNDTVVNGVAPAPNSPQKGIAIAFAQDGRRSPLSTIDAVGASGTFTVSVVVPVTAHAGSAQFEASRPEGPISQEFRVVARDTELPHTGLETSRLVLAGISALASGFMLFALRRRAMRTP
jgi:LPXTG-motif cell wall-anchored protein